MDYVNAFQAYLGDFSLGDWFLIGLIVVFLLGQWRNMKFNELLRDIHMMSECRQLALEKYGIEAMSPNKKGDLKLARDLGFRAVFNSKDIAEIRR